MVYAIIETGGKQVRVEPGRFYDVERLHLEIQDSLTIDRVLLVRTDDGTIVGQPLVEGALVQTRVLLHGKGAKVIVYKMRPKKNYRRKNGHRQLFTRLLVESIDHGGQSFKARSADVPVEDAVPEPATASST